MNWIVRKETQKATRQCPRWSWLELCLCSLWFRRGTACVTTVSVSPFQKSFLSLKHHWPPFLAGPVELLFCHLLFSSRWPICVGSAVLVLQSTYSPKAYSQALSKQLMHGVPPECGVQRMKYDFMGGDCPLLSELIACHVVGLPLWFVLWWMKSSKNHVKQ